MRPHHLPSNAAILVAICSKAGKPEKYLENSRRHFFISDDELIKRYALATSEFKQLSDFLEIQSKEWL
jgi:hypothetical protein